MHETLAVVFEDAHGDRERCGAETMSVLRPLALNLLRQDDSKGSLKAKRKRAAWDDFRAAILKHLSLEFKA